MNYNTTNNSNHSTCLKCIQINLRHSRLAALHFSQLIIDLNIDIVFIQEPYAIPSSLGAYLKSVPDLYAPFHSLSSDHAYGAVILVKKSLKAEPFSVGCTNEIAGSKLNVRNNEIFLFSFYCRPSIVNLNAHLSSFSNALLPSVQRKSVPWFEPKKSYMDSPTLDAKGKVVADFLSNIEATVANTTLHKLSFIQNHTSFLDITARSRWHCRL